MSSQFSDSPNLPRVLHVIGAMDRGGAESLIMNIYRSIDRSRIQFDFLVHETRKCDFDDEILALGGRIFSIERFNGINLIAYKRYLARFFRDHHGYSAVHVHIGSSAAFVIHEAHKFGLFCIAHSHNTNPDLSFMEIGFRIFSYPTRYLADYFFACSRQAGIDRFGLNVVNGSNFNVVNNGIQLHKYIFSSLDRERVRSQLGLSTKDRAICHIGRFSIEKNHDFLIKVFNEYLKHEPNSYLFLIGRGPLQEDIKRLVLDLGIESRVKFLGVRDDVPNLLNAMDLFLFPSKWEGLGIAAIEAQASGLPCILSPSLPSLAFCCPYALRASNITDIDSWVMYMLSTSFRSDNTRTDGWEYVLNAGFDITDTADQLTNFYLNH